MCRPPFSFKKEERGFLGKDKKCLFCLSWLEARSPYLLCDSRQNMGHEENKHVAGSVFVSRDYSV